MTNLETRVEQLERRATRYRNALMLLVLGLCAVAVIGATTDNHGIVEARAIRLMNHSGNMAVQMGADIDDNGIVLIYSDDGKTVVRLGSTAGDGFVEVLGRKGKGRTLQPEP